MPGTWWSTRSIQIVSGKPWKPQRWSPGKSPCDKRQCLGQKYLSAPSIHLGPLVSKLTAWKCTERRQRFWWLPCPLLPHLQEAFPDFLYPECPMWNSVPCYQMPGLCVYFVYVSCSFPLSQAHQALHLKLPTPFSETYFSHHDFLELEFMSCNGGPDWGTQL